MISYIVSLISADHTKTALPAKGRGGLDLYSFRLRATARGFTHNSGKPRGGIGAFSSWVFAFPAKQDCFTEALKVKFLASVLNDPPERRNVALANEQSRRYFLCHK